MDSKMRTRMRSLSMPESPSSDPSLGGFGLGRRMALIWEDAGVSGKTAISTGLYNPTANGQQLNTCRTGDG